MNLSSGLVQTVSALTIVFWSLKINDRELVLVRVVFSVIRYVMLCTRQKSFYSRVVLTF